MLRLPVCAGALVVLGLLSAGAAEAKLPREAVELDLTTSRRADPMGRVLLSLNRVAPFRARTGGRTYRVTLRTSTLTTLGPLQAVEIAQQEGYGAVLEQPLTAAQARSLKVVRRLSTDADVLAVAIGHPACRGLTLAQAQGIANGAITGWSAVVTGAPVEPISVVVDGLPGSPTPRFGVPVRRGARGFEAGYAPGTRVLGSPLNAAAADPGVAAITTWRTARAVRDRVCVVPLDGVEPGSATVRSLAYPGAFPLDVAFPRRPRGLDVKGYQAAAKHLASPSVAALLRREGYLPLADPLPADPPSAVAAG